MSKFRLVRKSIAMNVRIQGKTEKVYTGISVATETDFNVKSQKIKGEGTAIAAKNQKLTTFKNQVEAFIQDADRANRKITIVDLKDHLTSVMGSQSSKQNDRTKDSFIKYMENEINSPRKTKRKNGSIRPVSEKTIETYSSALFHLKKYLEKRRQRDITLKELGYKWFDLFEDYLIDDGKATNTISKHKAILKRMLNFATRDGFVVDASFKDVRCYNEDSIALYLNDDELEQLGNIKLKGTQKAIRDVFLFCCLTGCRWKDALQLNKDNFKLNMGRWFINYRQNKTGNEVYCPVFYKKALELIEENNYSFAGFHNDHTNKTVRKILIDNDLLQEEIEVVHSCRKYAAKTFKRAELVTFHTSRRSFCTNLFLKGISLSMIKMGSGHSSDSSLLMYLKQDKKTEAEMIMKAEMTSLQRLEMFAA